ncbi:MAG: MBL fold metallo-hydrolase, partial [Phycisphaerae bacterium]|nr:MBL fold metallo-hydrolase [Phycisphaerae bacterium]
LADSAHIQQEDAEYWNKKRVMRRGDAPIEPLYTQTDVDATTRLLQPRRLDKRFDVMPGVQAMFYEAGHMLGSAGMLIEFPNGNGSPTRVVYTGDLGRPGVPILRDPDTLPPCDYLICESTYGGRESPPPRDMRGQFADLINEAVERGGKIIIPAFAVGRTQVIVYHYHYLMHEGKIARPVPIIVDSPLAVRATEVFRLHPEVYDREAYNFNHVTGDMLECQRCEYIQNVNESKALHGRPGPMIIISASGMCEAGRILHHLKNNVENPHNTIVIVGYQAAHTLGRRLVEKQKTIRIFGENYRVRAKVKTLNGFSAHACASELANAISRLAGRARKVCLVHGESDQSEALAAAVRKRGVSDVLIPEPGQTLDLN